MLGDVVLTSDGYKPIVHQARERCQMIEAILTEQLVSTILETASGQVKALFSHKREKEKVAELIEEYRMKSHGIQSNVDLPAKMDSPHLIEELLAHCVLGDMTREDAVVTFVGKDADQHARDFGRDLFERMYRLISKTETPEALSCQPGINRSLVTEEKILQRMDDVDRRLLDLSSPDINTQMALLQTVVSSLESESLAVSDLPSLIKKCNNSQAGKYLQSYLSLCCNDKCCSELPDVFYRRDNLVIPIVMLAISAGNYEYALTTLSLVSFDSSMLKAAIRNIFISGSVPQKTTEIIAPATLNLESFSTLLNAEMAYSHKAYVAAESLFSQLNGNMNPVSKFHFAISSLASDALYGRGSLVERTKATISESHDWMPVELFCQLADALIMACTVADTDLLENALQSAPEHLQQYLEEPRIILELSKAYTFEEALMLMARGGQCRSTTAFLEAAIKALTFDTSCRQILAKEFLKNRDWVFASPVAFAFYVKELADVHSYQEFRELGARIGQSAEYHLLAYDLFKETDPNIAEEHMESALVKLREGMANPIQAFPEIWVSFLIENNHGEDVIEIANPFLPCESFQAIRYFLAICRHCDDNGVIFDRLLEVLANSDVADTRVPEFLARYFASIDDVATAGRLALKAFRLHRTETCAAIIANWCIASSLELDEIVRDYIAHTDTQMMNLVGADIAEAEGNSTHGDKLLIRAAFREGSRAEHALAAYAARHIGDTDSKEYRVVEQDTCVTVEAEDGTAFRIFFFSESDALVEPCALGPAGKAFLTKTPTFISVRGRSIGETVTIANITGRISEIESVEAGLSRQGFSLIAKDPHTRVINAADGEDFLEQIVDVMRPHSSSLNTYINGIIVDGTTVYPGIETARMFGAPDKLEFTIEAIMSGGMPFRRYSFSRNSAVKDEDTYLLSYSATVCLALLKPPTDTIESVSAKCSITESTARRLENECQAILDDRYTSPGTLALVDGKPTLLQNDDAVKQQWRDIVLCISELISTLQKTAPSTRVPTFEYADLLGDNTAIDIQTAIDNSLVYVTEDCLEAQTIDASGSLSRCSLSALLIACREFQFFFGDFHMTMQKWEAQPALEEDIIHALNATAKQVRNE